MEFAIELVFSDKTQEQLNKIKNSIKHPELIDKTIKESHITIANVLTNNVQRLTNIISNLARSFSSFECNLTSVGSFMDSRNVLFLSPNVTEKLLKINRKLNLVLKKYGIENSFYCLNENWNPHSSLALKLSDLELNNYFGVLKLVNTSLPIKAVVDKIIILQHDIKPNVIVKSFWLRQ